jgi:hypothetical protein
MKGIGKCLVLLLSVGILSSCTVQKNGGNTKQSDTAEFTPVEQIYDGYEELQGKAYDSFKMPEAIDVSEVSELYSFTCESKSQTDFDVESKQFFKAFFGEAYDENNCDYDGESTYSYTTDDGNAAYFTEGTPISGYKENCPMVSTDYSEYIGRYSATKDSEQVLELDGEKCTVGEVCDSLSSFIDEAFYPLYGDFEIYPLDVDYFFTASSKYAVEITCGIKYKGVPLEDYFSPMFVTEERNGYEVATSYSPSHMIFDLYGKDNITFFNSRFASRNIKTTELSEIISLKSATELLQNELAQNSNYQFEEVKLMYCCKSTYPIATDDEELNSKMQADFADVEPAPFEPTWCFFWYTDDGSRQAVKVNAVTGEITVDVG